MKFCFLVFAVFMSGTNFAFASTPDFGVTMGDMISLLNNSSPPESSSQRPYPNGNLLLAERILKDYRLILKANLIDVPVGGVILKAPIDVNGDGYEWVREFEATLGGNLFRSAFCSTYSIRLSGRVFFRIDHPADKRITIDSISNSVADWKQCL